MTRATPTLDDPAFVTRAAAFAAIHAGREAQALVPNIHARVEALHTALGALPVTVHDARGGDAWVCSPRTTYADCAGEEAARYLPRRLAPLAMHGLGALGGALSLSGIDRAVSINNWLLSTNLYPRLGSFDAATAIGDAVQRWPRHTLWFRSLNAQDNADWIEALRGAGCQLVASRQVWLYEDFQALAQRHANLKRDLALLQRTPLQPCADHQVTDADYARIARLYAWLYIGKYSRFNPVYGERFLRQWHRAGLLHFSGYRDARGQLVCVVGLFREGRTATAPIVGYDTAQPRSLGLYRLATACAYQLCMAHGWRLNFSAGAAHFKRLRGGMPAIEYSAVYARHLPAHTRAAVFALSAATCRIGSPLLRRYQL